MYILREAADAIRLVAGQRRIDGEAEQAFLTESEVDVLQVVQGTREEGRGNQEQQGKRNLRNDQGFPQTYVASRRGNVARMVLQREGEFWGGGLPGWGQPKHDTGEKREPEREGEHTQVRRCGKRKLRGIGEQSEESAARPPREENSDGAPGEREYQAFRNQLPHQQETAGAHGQADRDLLLPAHGARQQQVGNVGAGDEQQHADDPEQDEERIGELFAQVGKAIAGRGEDQRFSSEPGAAALRAELHRLHLHDQQTVVVGFHARLRLAQADTGAKASHELQPDGAPVVEPVPGGRHLRFHHGGYQDVDTCARVEAVIPGCGHTDYGHGMAVKQHGLIEEGGIAVEARFPKVVSEHDDRMGGREPGHRQR